MSDTLCTLFEGDYHLGAAGLINSLHKGGFAGTVVCGYRGKLPFWHALPAETLAPIRLIWVEITQKIHLTNWKPVFINECWTQYTPDADRMYYADPDLVIKAPWHIVARWAADGLAVCEDINSRMLARHPYRLLWLDFLAEAKIRPVRELNSYYNAGFVGLPRVHRSLLPAWQSIMDAAASRLGPMDRLKNGRPWELFHSMDQDALNMALLLGDWPLNTTGPEGMDFIPGGSLLSHAAGGIKPWRKGFVRAAFRGVPPGPAQKRFFDHVEGPIPVFTPAELRRRRRALEFASFVGRFYRRG